MVCGLMFLTMKIGESVNVAGLTVTRRGDDWHVCLFGRPGDWACGKSPEEAVGNLVLHRSDLGLTVEGD